MKRSILTIDGFSIFDEVFIEEHVEEIENDNEFLPPVQELSIWVAKRNLRDAITRLDIVAFKIIGSTERDKSKLDSMFKDVSSALNEVQNSLPLIRGAWIEEAIDGFIK